MKLLEKRFTYDEGGWFLDLDDDGLCDNILRGFFD